MRPSSLPLLLLPLLLHQGFSTADATVETTCRNAAVRNSYLNYNTCVDVLNKDPRSAAAGTKELADIAGQIALSRAYTAQTQISDLQNGDLYNPPDPPIDALFAGCSRTYDQAKLTLKDAFYSMQASQNEDAIKKLAAARDMVQDCGSSFSNAGALAAPVSEICKEVAQLAHISLSILNLVVG